MIRTGSEPFEVGDHAHAQRIHRDLERDGDWFIAYSPEIPGANGQDHTLEEARQSLAETIGLVFEDRREEGLHGKWIRDLNISGYDRKFSADKPGDRRTWSWLPKL